MEQSGENGFTQKRLLDGLFVGDRVLVIYLPLSFPVWQEIQPDAVTPLDDLRHKV